MMDSTVTYTLDFVRKTCYVLTYIDVDKGQYPFRIGYVKDVLKLVKHHAYSPLLRVCGDHVHDRQHA